MHQTHSVELWSEIKAVSVALNIVGVPGVQEQIHLLITAETVDVEVKEPSHPIESQSRWVEAHPHKVKELKDSKYAGKILNSTTFLLADQERP